MNLPECHFLFHLSLTFDTPPKFLISDKLSIICSMS